MLRNKDVLDERGDAPTDDVRYAQLLRNHRRLQRELLQARRFAYHDALTGLPNRLLLLDRLKQALSQAARQRKTVGALFIDLDAFNQINDSFGHSAGDAVLRRVAARLSGCIRDCDTACRYGGDEFVILLPEIQGVRQLDSVKRKIAETLSRPHRVGNRVVAITGSIGGAVLGRDSTTGKSLIAAADADTYRVKRSSRSR